MCHLSPAAGSLRRIRLANTWPNLSAHWRPLIRFAAQPWLAMMLRKASNSSTMRRLTGKR